MKPVLRIARVSLIWLATKTYAVIDSRPWRLLMTIAGLWLIYHHAKYWFASVRSHHADYIELSLVVFFVFCVFSNWPTRKTADVDGSS